MAPTRILLIGATGKLGSRIAHLADPETFPIVGLATRASPSLENSLPLTDVVLDVSTPEALETNLPLIVSQKIPIVIGSTGHSEKNLLAIQKASKTIPILLTSNFSIGIHLLKHLLKEMPLEGSYAIEEIHHTKKKDSPSGTALDLCATLKGKAEITSIREGDVIGSHKVTLSLLHEKITLSHEALSRDIFALGALKACSFLYHKPKGLYNSFYD